MPGVRPGKNRRDRTTGKQTCAYTYCRISQDGSDPVSNLRVKLLGPVEVVADGRLLPVSGERRKAVLAALALRSGEIVSTGDLLDAVWGQAPPATGVRTLSAHVSYLRHMLAGHASILAHPPGYLLDLSADGTDVRFAE